MKKIVPVLLSALFAAPVAHADIVGGWTFVSSNDPEYIQAFNGNFEFRADGTFSTTMITDPGCTGMSGVWSNDTGSSFLLRATSVTCMGKVMTPDFVENVVVSYARVGSTVTVTEDGFHYVFQVGPEGSTQTTSGTSGTSTSGTSTSGTTTPSTATSGTPTPPSVLPSVAGSVTSQTIGVGMAIASGAGVQGSVFAAALLPANLGGSVFVLSSSGVWTPFTGCAGAPAYYSGLLPSSLNVPVVPTPTNLSGLKGTAVILGHGKGQNAAAACEDMLNSNTFAVAHVIN